MEQVFLSLGSNLGDRLAYLRQALRSIEEFAEITALSDAYETEPVEFTAQPWFLNAVVGLHLQHAMGTENGSEDGPSPDAPERLLQRLLAVEQAMGRQRVSSASILPGSAPDGSTPAGFIPKGPRVIDLDLVLYGSRVICTPTLTVPHPAMHLRRFVLQPLADIAPNIEHPLLRQSALELLRKLPPQGPSVRRFAALRSGEE